MQWCRHFWTTGYWTTGYLQGKGKQMFSCAHGASSINLVLIKMRFGRTWSFLYTVWIFLVLGKNTYLEFSNLILTGISMYGNICFVNSCHSVCEDVPRTSCLFVISNQVTNASRMWFFVLGCAMANCLVIIFEKSIN